MRSVPQNKDIYTSFARGYDVVMRDVDFPQWSEHVLRLIDHFEFNGKRLLNVACGTGNMEMTWAAAGYSIASVDRSLEMLEIARIKIPKSAAVELIQSDMTTLDLGEKFDLATCLYDSVNYLTNANDVRKFFHCAASHLATGGGFIFDVATEANILENFSQTTYAENFEDFAYIWDNEYNIRTKICKSDFHFFYKDPEDGSFRRQTEVHYQKIYTTRDLSKWLKQAGFEVLGVFDGFNFDSAGSSCDRIHFIARKL